MASTTVINRLTSDLNTILSISRSMTLERDLDTLLDIILQATTSLVSADRSSLFIVEGETIWTRVAQGSGVIRLPIGTGIAGTVAHTGVCMNIPNAYEDDRFDPQHDRRSGYMTTSILCLPLVNHNDHIVGVIQVLNKENGEPFSEYDENVLSALCSQAAVAIEKTQLISRDIERQRMARDMELARSIQRRLLPDAAPKLSAWDLQAWQTSCDETSGDYHDFVRGDGWCDVIIGDVSGHGIGAALLMGTARAFLLGLYRNESTPEQRIADLNDLLEKDMADDVFMTMCICRLYDDGRCGYVSAGHEPPLIYRASTQQIEIPEETGMMLGVLEGNEYDYYEINDIGPDDRLLLFTDGIFECIDAETEKSWGMLGLSECVQKHGQKSVSAIVDAIRHEVCDHMAGTPSQDDMTLVVVGRKNRALQQGAQEQ